MTLRAAAANALASVRVRSIKVIPGSASSGCGQYAIGSITTVDFPAIMSVTVIISVFFVLSNFLVDLLYFYLDPRLRTA